MDGGHEMIVSALLVLLLVAGGWLLPLFACVRMAEQKGKDKGLWIFLALLFGWLAVLVLAASASER
jgi:hypothetical protein